MKYSVVFLLCFFLENIHAQNNCLALPDTVIACGFTAALPETAFPSQWVFLCNESAGIIASDVTVTPNEITVAECGDYYFSYTGTTTDCIVTDTVLVHFDDPGNANFNGEFIAELEYNDYGCHGGGSGCSQGGPTTVTIGGATPPETFWNFTVNGSCTAQNFLTEAVNPSPGDCIAEGVSVISVETSDSDVLSIDTSQAYGLENYTALQDSLFNAYLSGALAGGCNLNNLGCASICIDNPDQDGPESVFDTIVRILPYRVGGNWSLVLADTCLLLEDTTIFNYDENTGLRLTVTPGADYYGPAGIDWTLEQQFISGTDTIYGDIQQDFFLTAQWKEFFEYDTLTEIRERMIDDEICSGCGGTSVTFSENAPTVPTYDCGPVSLSFFYDYCACNPLFVDAAVLSEVDCNGDAEVQLFASEPGVWFINTPGGNFETVFSDTYTTAVPGTYFVEFLSDQGCFEFTSFAVTGDLEEFNSEFSATVAAGDCYSWNGISYCESGNYEQFFVAESNGCDSTVILTLTVEEQQIINEYLQACEGECVDWYGVQYCATGQYMQAVQDNTTTILYNLEVFIEPLVPVEIINSSVLDCDNEAVTLTAVAASSQFVWSNGATGNTLSVSEPGNYFVTAISDSGCESFATTVVTDESENTVTETAATICANDCYDFYGTTICESGIYENITTDGNCTTTEFLTLEIEEEMQIEVTQTTALNCENASADITVTGGSGNYLWSNGATGSTVSVTTAGAYTVTTFSENNCATTASIFINDESENTVTETAATICANDCYDFYGTTICESGIYENITTDGNCTTTEFLTLEIEEEMQIEINASGMLNCETESVVLTATGGSGDILWSDGSTNSTLTVSTAGTVTATVSSALGCTSIAEYTVTQDIEDIELPAAAAQNISCATGAATPAVVAYENYFYAWTTEGNETPVSTEINPDFTVPNNYILTVTNPTNGCIGMTEFTVLPQPEITAFATASPTCENAADGVVIAENPSGGTPPYLFSVDGENWQTEAVFTDLPAGEYTLQVIDNEECTTSVQTETEELPGLPELNITALQFSLCGEEEAVLDAAVADAPNLAYLWQDGSTAPVFTAVTAGDYSVIISNECAAEELTFTVAATSLDLVSEIFIPNVFSPSGAPENRIFRPFFNREMMNFDMEIFDRWGSPVFRSTDPITGWNGTHDGETAMQGVYIWRMAATVSGCDGSTETVEMSGDVLLLK